MRDSGGNVSLAPQIEVQMGHGWAPAAKAESLGIKVLDEDAFLELIKRV